MDGHNLQVELRGAGGDWARLLGFAAEIEQGNPNVIVMNNGTAARRLQEKIRSVPICVAGGYLQAAGAVANLAKPEGNVTGVQVFQPNLAGKRLALLKEAVPGLTRVAVLLGESTTATTAAVLKATQDAGRTLRIAVDTAEVQRATDFDRLFAILTQRRPGVIASIPR